MTDEPTVSELIKVGARAVRGADRNADTLRGSDYESLIGPSAIIWSREAARDTDLFNATNLNTADGTDLTELVDRRYGVTRVLDSRGTGYVELERPAGGVQETFWLGSHFTVLGGSPQTYRTTAKVIVPSADKNIRLPIEALEFGVAPATDVLGSTRIDDPVLDSTWRVVRLVCAPGSVFETAPELRARVRRERQTERQGQIDTIVAACKSAGADHVVLFQSDYAGDEYDHGLNFCYVGTSGYVSTPELLKACTLAVRAARVAGDSMQVLGMTSAMVDVEADVYLSDSPALHDLTRLERIHASAVQQYLDSVKGSWAYSFDGIRSAIRRHTPQVQRVNILAPLLESTIVVGVDKNFPPVLTRYLPGRIKFHYLSN